MTYTLIIIPTTIFGSIWMTANAVVQVGNALMFFLDVGRGVFVAAIAGVLAVVRGGMAQSAIAVGSPMIQGEFVIEAGRLPGGGTVASGTLTREVVVGLILVMAGLAISRSRSAVGERSRFPGSRAVASGTLPGEMVVGLVLVMAGLAISCSCSVVVETGWFPGVGAVAGGTLT